MSHKTKYNIKFIDEYGECYNEIQVEGLVNRQKVVRSWSGKDSFTRLDVDDVIVLAKYNGEELWTFAENT